jgi:hypothetical protein
MILKTKTTNSVALVRERIIPTERLPLVGEVNVNVLRIEVVAWSAHPDPYGSILGFPDLNSTSKILQIRNCVYGIFFSTLHSFHIK